MTLSNEYQPCKYCHSKMFLQSWGEIVCSKCGTVFERVLIPSSHTIDEGTYLNPTPYVGKGYRINRPDKLGSEIGSKTFHSVKFRRLKKIQNLSEGHSRAFLVLDQVASSLNLSSNIKERTIYLYWKYWKSYEQTNKKNRYMFLALCLLYTIREKKVPYRFQDVISAFRNRGHKVTNRNVMKLASILNINMNKVGIRKSEDYVSHLTEKLSGNIQVQQHLPRYGWMSPGHYQAILSKISFHLLDTFGQKRRVGIRPFGFTVAIISVADRYIAKFYGTRTILTQPQIAILTGVGRATIRDYCSKLKLWSLLESQLSVITKILEGEPV